MLRFLFFTRQQLFYEMIRTFLIFVMVLGGLTSGLTTVNSQPAEKPASPQEVSELDGLPVLLKHLPEWENVRANAVFVTDIDKLRSSLGDRPIFSLIEFTGGTEAVTAPYPEGKLLIIEYTTPQASVEADAKFESFLAQNAEPRPIVYRRVGNYSVFVFDAGDRAAASALIDRVRYEKTVQWLGENPFLLRQIERYFVTTTRDIFVSTVVFIIAGICTAVLAGVVIGFFFFRKRDNRRASQKAFSDAGGLTRLNLDELSEEIPVP